MESPIWKHCSDSIYDPRLTGVFNCFAHIAETAKQITVLLKNYSKAYSKTSKSIWAI